MLCFQPLSKVSWANKLCWFSKPYLIGCVGCNIFFLPSNRQNLELRSVLFKSHLPAQAEQKASVVSFAQSRLPNNISAVLGEVGVNPKQSHTLPSVPDQALGLRAFCFSTQTISSSDNLHKDQKGLENQHAQGHDVPATQRTSHNSGSMPKTQELGKSYHFSTSCFPIFFIFFFSLSLSSLLLSAEGKLQYVEHMGKESLKQHSKKKKKRKSSSEKRFSY